MVVCANSRIFASCLACLFLGMVFESIFSIPSIIGYLSAFGDEFWLHFLKFFLWFRTIHIWGIIAAQIALDFFIGSIPISSTGLLEIIV